MRFDLADSDFVDGLVSWLRTLDDESLSNIATVLRLSPGYYPTAVAAQWSIEVRRRGLTEVTLDTGRFKIGNSLPVSHPGDYEWRFTQHDSQALAAQATYDFSAGSVVAHLGTPSTFIAGIEHQGHLCHVLFERNLAVVSAVALQEGSRHQVVHADLMIDDLPRLGAAAAIVDPPWYPADTLAFLSAAAHLCASDARIFLCQPTEATRPGVVAERQELIEALPAVGLTLIETRKSAVRYQMPHFEAVSLRTSIPSLSIPFDWRTGDLLVLSRQSVMPQRRRMVVAEAEFREVSFGPVRIKLRQTIGSDLGDLVSGSVLNTVSRRDPIRSEVGFWTSGNRVFQLCDVERIGKLIQLCHTDFMESRFTLARMIVSAAALEVDADIARKLFDILLIELQEHVFMKAEGQ